MPSGMDMDAAPLLVKRINWNMKASNIQPCSWPIQVAFGTTYPPFQVARRRGV